MKGIVLAGGSGSRLFPLTRGVSKQMLPVYDKPMIYYPLSVLMLADIRDILIITTVEDQSAFQRLLGDGSQWGLRLEYKTQVRPEGLAQAFIIGADFIGDDSVALVLGDNIFYGPGFGRTLREASQQEKGARVFAYPVRDPQRYGVVEFSTEGKAVSLEEKPKNPKSEFAVTGLYFYDQQVIARAASLKPSARGELEITDLNRLYLEAGELAVKNLGRGFAWLDTGTQESMLQASNYIEAIQKNQGLQVSCPEEIAWRRGWIDAAQVEKQARPMEKNAYGQFLLRMIGEK